MVGVLTVNRDGDVVLVGLTDMPMIVMALPLDRHRAAAAAEICAEEVTDGADGAYLHTGRAAPAVAYLADFRLAACICLLHEQKIARTGLRAAAAADAAVFMDAYAHNDLL